MLAPHLAAVWMAARGRAFWSGVLAGVAFLVNAKGVFVLAACALWIPRALPQLALGFAAPCTVAGLWLWQQGALPAYYEEVWKWGRLYAADTFIESPLSNGFQRTWHWAGFHAAILVAAVLGLKSENRRWKFVAWALLSLAADWRGRAFLLPLLLTTPSRRRDRRRGGASSGTGAQP